MAPLTRKGYDWFQFKQSRAVGYEADAADNEAKAEAAHSGHRRRQSHRRGVSTRPSTPRPKAFYVECKQNLDDCLAAIESLGGAVRGEIRRRHAWFRRPAHGARRSPVQPSTACCKRSASSSRTKRRRRQARPKKGAGDASAASDSGAGAPARGRKTVSEEPADKDDACSRIAMVARFLRREDPYSPAPYLMLRGLGGANLRSGGDAPSLELLAPPATQVRQELKRLSVESNWTELLEAAENAMALPCGRAWLDLQRYAVRALDAYGYPAIAVGHPIGIAVAAGRRAASCRSGLWRTTHPPPMRKPRRG